jgi:hypothetical protein
VSIVLRCCDGDCSPKALRLAARRQGYRVTRIDLQNAWHEHQQSRNAAVLRQEITPIRTMKTTEITIFFRNDLCDANTRQKDNP